MLEDDTYLGPAYSVANLLARADTLFDVWNLASFNVHESVCLEDAVNDDWLLRWRVGHWHTLKGYTARRLD